MSDTLLVKGGSASVEPAPQKIDCTYFDFKDQEKSWTAGSDIEAALPEKYLFGIGEVYLVIGGLIAAQAEGQEGVLKNTGDYNIFYTEKFCVSVGWYSGDGRWIYGRGFWRVRAWDRGKGWRDGGRVFSPGLEA